ncbi:MAG TPA: tetratricopeptide repeat protein [Actinomycetota bacterium]|nr:tetratricopeptide repeat protein [Actinomycetota bacterium]
MRFLSRGSKGIVERAASLRRAGDFTGAIDVLADALTLDPEDAAANAEMARALRLIGDPAGAEEHIRVALKTVLDYQLVVELAGVVAEQNRIKEAQGLIDAALSMAEGNPRLDPGEALLVRAAIEAGRGKKKEALKALDAIVPKRASGQVKEYAARMRADLEASGSA